MNSSSKEAAPATREASNVVSRILEEFVSHLEQDAELKEIAPAMRKTLLEDKDYSEASLRAAQFPEAK